MNTSLQRLGKYRLQERLGGSSIAEVWKAFSPQLRRYVAVKLLRADLKNDPRFITRFEREARAIASLHHPNIVQVHDFQVSRTPIIAPGSEASEEVPQTSRAQHRWSDGFGSRSDGLMPSGEGSTDSNIISYLVMDYIDGSTLADYINNTSRKKNFPPATAIVHLFASICAAIDYAHQKGVIHGDIKPANILLDTHIPNMTPDGEGVAGKQRWSDGLALSSYIAPDGKGVAAMMGVGKPIVTDFGITRLLGTPAATLSRWGLVTPFYISPKQAMGYEGDVNSDIYSLGVMLYEICTGVPPFQGDSPSVIMMQHITATPNPPEKVNPDISSALSTLILRSLDKNPKMRFSDASSMAAALAEVLGVPIPDTLTPPYHTTLSTYSMSDREELGPEKEEEQRWSDESVPTPAASWSPSPPHSSPDWPPPTPAFASASASSLLKLTLGKLGIGTNPPHHGLHVSLLPRPAQAGQQATATQSGAMQVVGRRRKGVLRDSHLVLLAILILMLIVSSLGTLLVLAHKNTPIAAQQFGHVYFVSSGQLYLSNNQGINDKVLIDLHGIAAPHAGKSYYAWLLGDENAAEIPWLLLGKVSEYQGNAHFLYDSDVAHTDLLTDMSRFVITEEDANTTPNDPLLDQSTWRYHGKIFQAPSPKDVNHFSMLDHIRHLLVQAPELNALGLPGGLSIWLLRNTEEIWKWALNAKEAWETKNTMLMSRQLINILYYIDGECTQRDFKGMPTTMPTTPENATIARVAHFSLINPCIQEEQDQANLLKQVFSHTPHDYVDHILFHLAGVMQSPGTTPTLHTLAVQLNTAINYVKGWLEQVRQDALQLADMSNDQLTQLSSLGILSDIEVQARYAYAGQTDPSTAQVQEGAAWIYDNMQRLTGIDVTSYPPR